MRVGEMILVAAQSCTLPWRRVALGSLFDILSGSKVCGLAEYDSAIRRCVAGFQTCAVPLVRSAADLEVGDTAGLETCATFFAPRGAKKGGAQEVRAVRKPNFKL